ncbi:MAG: DinB family protein [Planctomycetota bacterium]
MSDGDLVQSADPGPVEGLQTLGVPALISRFAIGVDRLDARVFELPSEELDRAWPIEAGVGKWPIRVLLGHLADAELAYVHRMRRVVAEPGCEIALWDEHAFIDAGHYGVVAHAEGGDATRPPIGAAVAVIHTLRGWMGPWLSELPGDAWSKRGLHPERGLMTLRDLLVYDTWHLERHAWRCNQKVAKLADRS